MEHCAMLQTDRANCLKCRYAVSSEKVG